MLIAYLHFYSAAGRIAGYKTNYTKRAQIRAYILLDKTSLSFSGRSIRRRLLFVALGAALFIAAYSFGAAAKMTPEEAKEVRKGFAQQIEKIDQRGIFANNFMISLGMFVPGAGIALGSLSGYATGSVFAAIAHDTTQLQGVPPQIILLTPFGIMEVFVYGLAMSRSGLLVYSLARERRQWRRFGAATAIEIGIAAAVLFAGAAVEWWMIQQFGGLNLDPGLGI